MRGKLDDRYASYVQAPEKEKLLAALAQAEEWLYSEEGEDATKSVYVEKLDSLTQATPLDPTKFTFFKGLNDKSTDGTLSVTVPGGLPAGVYRIATINSSANHQPALVAVAQRGALDDMI